MSPVKRSPAKPSPNRSIEFDPDQVFPKKH